MEEFLDNTPQIHHPGLKRKLLIDIRAQSALFAIVALYCLLLLVMNEDDFIGPAMLFYFGVGAYQLVSSLVHLAYRQKTSLYRAYYIQLFIHLFVFLSAFMGGGILSLMLLLCLTPITAIYYYVITLLSYNHNK